MEMFSSKVHVTALIPRSWDYLITVLVQQIERILLFSCFVLRARSSTLKMEIRFSFHAEGCSQFQTEFFICQIQDGFTVLRRALDIDITKSLHIKRENAPQHRHQAAWYCQNLAPQELREQNSSIFFYSLI